jgi:excisionase family DNA binding protein
MDWISTKQAAAKLGVTVMRVRQYIKAKKLKAQRLGREWMVSAASVAGFERPELGRPPKRKRGGK